MESERVRERGAVGRSQIWSTDRLRSIPRIKVNICLFLSLILSKIQFRLWTARTRQDQKAVKEAQGVDEAELTDRGCECREPHN